MKVNSRADIAHYSNIDTNLREPRRFYMPPAGFHEEPSPVEIIDAKKQLMKLVTEREKLESRHHQKMELLQEQEVARNRKRKAEIDAMMKGQSAGEAMARAADSGTQAVF